jgi:TRAP-type C4-dicarboxylate transport system substrate-binding protein
VNKLGEPADPTVTLSAVSAQGLDEVATYATTVDQLSGGRLRLEIAAAPSTPPVEPGVVDSVRSGAVDVGFVGARVWASEGSHAFDALQAPLLIDSYELQQQVLTSDIVDSMTTNLDVDGISGLGVLPGPLRYIAGRAGPMRTPDDFAGTTIGISDAAIPRQVVESLGATAVPIGTGAQLDALDGVEGHVGALVGNQYLSSMAFVTSNLPMWPRPITVFMNRTRFDALSDQQRSWLLAAARTVTPSKVQALVNSDAEELGVACRTGIRLEAASTGDRSALLAALRSVEADLRADPATAKALDSIAELKSQGPALLACDDEAAASHSTESLDTSVDGSWTSCPTVDDILAAGADAGEARGNAGCVTLTFEHGVFTESGASAADGRAGSYGVTGDQLTVNRANGERFQFTFGFFRDTMILSRPDAPDAVSPAPWRSLPFSRQGA